jgi:hypothetical protein
VGDGRKQARAKSERRTIRTSKEQSDILLHFYDTDIYLSFYIHKNPVAFCSGSTAPSRKYYA